MLQLYFKILFSSFFILHLFQRYPIILLIFFLFSLLFFCGRLFSSWPKSLPLLFLEKFVLFIVTLLFFYFYRCLISIPLIGLIPFFYDLFSFIIFYFYFLFFIYYFLNFVFTAHLLVFFYCFFSSFLFLLFSSSFLRNRRSTCSKCFNRHSDWGTCTNRFWYCSRTRKISGYSWDCPLPVDQVSSWLLPFLVFMLNLLSLFVAQFLFFYFLTFLLFYFIFLFYVFTNY